VQEPERWIRPAFVFAGDRSASTVPDNAIERRLQAVAEKAVANVAEAENGNVNVSITLLKGLGVLGGTPPRLGSDDPQALAEPRFAEEMQRTSRLLAGLS
jgi:hypothetical protein